jgi:hypothetical protein
MSLTVTGPVLAKIDHTGQEERKGGTFWDNLFHVIWLSFLPVAILCAW